jgi:hypothetical protein
MVILLKPTGNRHNPQGKAPELENMRANQDKCRPVPFTPRSGILYFREDFEKILSYYVYHFNMGTTTFVSLKPVSCQAMNYSAQQSARK